MQNNINPYCLPPVSLLNDYSSSSEVSSEELIVSVSYCRQKQTVVAARGKVLSDTTEDTSEFGEVYLKATFDAAIYGDTPFDPLSAARILNCFYQYDGVS